MQHSAGRGGLNILNSLFTSSDDCEQSMLIMTSIIRVGQSKFVTVPIDEDSNERIMNCIQTISELKTEAYIHEVFLDDTKAAFTKMLGAQEVCVH